MTEPTSLDRHRSEPGAETRRDEVRRQNERLAEDRLARVLTAMSAVVLSTVLLPVGLIALVCLAILLTEVAYAVLARAWESRSSRWIYLGLLTVSTTGIAAFSLIPLLLWSHPDRLVQFTAMLFLVGILLNISLVRAIHLPIGMANFLPPGAVLLWLPMTGAMRAGTPFERGFALLITLALLAYFVISLTQNNRAKRRLALARARASASSQAKSRFLAAMSHEINTPLTAILGLAQILKDAEPGDDPGAPAARLEQAASALRMLVEDALELAEADDHAIRLRPVTVSVRTEVLAPLQRRLSHDTDGKPALEMSPSVPEMVRIDPVQFRRCLTHLAETALHCAPPGTPITVTCDLAPHLPDRDALTVTLTSDRPSVAHPTPPPPQECLAFALALHIAAAMGGTATATIGRDGHCIARLALPFEPVPALPQGPTPSARKICALVVDDIATNRFVVTRQLHSLGIDAAEAAGGDEALQYLSRHPADVVILDLNMPGMDGAATFRALRAGPAPWADTPVIALTADALAERRDACLAMGFSGYVPKPVDRRVLWSEVLGAIGSG